MLGRIMYKNPVFFIAIILYNFEMPLFIFCCQLAMTAMLKGFGIWVSTTYMLHGCYETVVHLQLSKHQSGQRLKNQLSKFNFVLLNIVCIKKQKKNVCVQRTFFGSTEQL